MQNVIVDTTGGLYAAGQSSVGLRLGFNGVLLLRKPAAIHRGVCSVLGRLHRGRLGGRPFLLAVRSAGAFVWPARRCPTAETHPRNVATFIDSWRERDDRHLFKAAAPLPVDPLDELIRVVNEAQERDAEDERRLYRPMSGSRSVSFQRRRPDRR
jgi:hypothetical protein